MHQLLDKVLPLKTHDQQFILPDVLSFYLIRAHNTTLFSSVIYLDILDLQAYKVNQSIYNLFGVIIYKESPKHYEAIVKRNQAWFWIDDMYEYTIKPEVAKMAGSPNQYKSFTDMTKELLLV